MTLGNGLCITRGRIFKVWAPFLVLYRLEWITWDKEIIDFESNVLKSLKVFSRTIGHPQTTRSFVTENKFFIFYILPYFMSSCYKTLSSVNKGESWNTGRVTNLFNEVVKIILIFVFTIYSPSKIYENGTMTDTA